MSSYAKYKHAYRKKRYPHTASGTIARGWKRYAKKKRGGLLTRTALSNRKAIKSLRRERELKFVGEAPASSRTNYIGNILSNTPVDNWGMSQSSGDWVIAGGAATSLAAPKYCPLIMNPIVVPQAGQPVVVGSTTLNPAGENTRIGNDIQMSHCCFKITMSGSVAQTNGGNYQNVVQKQSVTALLLLDREPAPQAASLTTSTPVFEPGAVSCQLYGRTPDNLIALPTQLSGHALDQIRSCPRTTANPPGLSTGDVGNKNMEALSFYSKDNIIGKTGRFEILKKIKLTCYQREGGDSAENLNGSSVPTTASKTYTQKGKYKFHFNSDRQIIPGNQTLLLVLYSDTPTVRSFGGSTPTDYVSPPTVTVLSRFSFRDS